MALNNVSPEPGPSVPQGKRKHEEPPKFFFRLADKAKLLCSDENPIFGSVERLVSVEDGAPQAAGRNKLIAEVYGVDVTTIRHWQNTRIKRTNSRQLQRSFKTICTTVAKRGVTLQASDFEDACDEYQFGDKFGLGWRKVQYILDKVRYVSPTEPRGFLSSQDDARRAFDELEGVWHLYHRRPIPRSSSGQSHSDQSNLDQPHSLTLSALRIRHIVEAHHELSYVACKLHVTRAPKPEDAADKAYISYNGLVTIRADCFYLSFEKRPFRGQGKLDMLTIRVRPIPNAKERNVLTGDISATTEQGILYSAAAYLQRVAIVNSEDRSEFVQRMRGDLKVYSSDEESALLSAFPMIGNLRPPYFP